MSNILTVYSGPKIEQIAVFLLVSLCIISKYLSRRQIESHQKRTETMIHRLNRGLNSVFEGEIKRQKIQISGAKLVFVLRKSNLSP